MSIMRHALTSKNYVLQDLKGCVMAFSWYQLHPDNKLCMQIRRESDDALLDVGFRNGYVDMDACNAFLDGSITGFITIWYNQSRIAGATNAVQEVAANQPRGIFYTNSINTMGVSFGGVSHYMTIESYPEIDIVGAPLCIYSNFRKSANTTSKYVLCRNLAESADRQYGFYVDNTPPNNIVQFFLQGSSRAALNASQYYSKALIRWYDGNILQDSDNKKQTTVYADTELTSTPSTFLGCRGATGGARSGFFDGQVRTIMVFNSKLSNVAVEWLRNYEF